MNKKIILTLSVIALSIPIQAMRVPSATKYPFALSTPKLEKIFSQAKTVEINKNLFIHLAVQAYRKTKPNPCALSLLIPQLGWQTQNNTLRYNTLRFGGEFHEKNKSYAFCALLNQLPWNGSEKRKNWKHWMLPDGILRYPVLVNDKEIELLVDDNYAYAAKREWVSRNNVKLAVFPFISVSSPTDYKDEEHHKKVCEEFDVLCKELNNHRENK